MGKRGPPKGDGGRPRTPIDLAVVRRAAGLGATNEEIAVLVGLERETIQRRLHKDPALQRSIEEGREQGRTTLRRLQWEQAQAGNPTMLIWLGKQLLGQRDRFDATAAVTHVVGGIDCPPRCDTLESAEQWLARRRKELAALSSPNPQPPIVDSVAEEQSPPESPPVSTPAPQQQQQQSSTPIWSAGQEEAWQRQQQRERPEGATLHDLWMHRERGPRRW